ncbi:MAG: trigger factor [Planctomycetes bacterium]|nr:trigger factor [Planctomycetota bacterium]
MSVTVTADGPCRRTLTFSIERSVLQAAIDQRVAQAASGAKLKGFRPGKAPIALVKKTYGGQAAEEARRQVMGQAFSEAVQEHSLTPVGDPEMNLEKLEDDGTGPFTFELAVEIVPEFELQIPETIPVTVTLPAIDDGMLETEIQRLREQGGTLQDVPEGETVAGEDILEGTIVYGVGDESLEPQTEKAVFLRHDLLDGIRVEGLAAHFVGKSLGDTVDVEVTLPEHFEPSEHAGASATARVTIDRLRRIQPAELDASFFERAGVADEADLRDRIQKNLEAQRERYRNQLVDREIDQVMIAAHEFPLPERLLSKAIDRRVHEVAHRAMEEAHQESEAAHHAAEEKRGEITELTTKGMRLAFVLNRIAQEQGLTASREAAEQQIRILAQQQNHDPEASVQHARSEGWVVEVQEQLTHNNARAWLRERAQITEQAPTEGDGGGESDD